MALITAMAWVCSLAQELAHATGTFPPPKKDPQNRNVFNAVQAKRNALSLYLAQGLSIYICPRTQSDAYSVKKSLNGHLTTFSLNMRWPFLHQTNSFVFMDEDTDSPIEERVCGLGQVT